MPPSSKPKMIAWRGEVFRATTYDEPLWVSANRRDGRFNLAGVGSTQYFCLDSEAPFAELLRGENLRTEAESVTFRSTLWQLRIDEGAIVDYRTFEQAEAQGFPAEALVEDDHERCQREAQRLRDAGARGLLTPSAALPGTTSLTLFGPRIPIAWATEVRLASAIPAQRLAQGSAPAGLTERVRYFGEVHRTLAAFQRS